VPDCGDYCDGYWYDAEGYSDLLQDESPPIYYSYPYCDEAEPVDSQEIAMGNSGATAWAPPVIYSVNGVAPPGEAQLPAGTTTAVTITGAGFGYSPSLTITGSGITGYTYACASNPSASCDTQIVATVTIDPNTPANSEETITVAAGGQNASGFRSIQVGPPGQATATAMVIQAPKPTIVWGQGQSACQSATQVPATVVIGQQIAFTACIPQLPAGTQVQSESWTPSLPPGTAVAGYNITYDNNNVAASAQVQAVSPTTCGTGSFCTYAPFYWVDQGNSRAFRFDYKLTNGSSNFGTISVNVTGPNNASMTATPSNPVMVLQDASSRPLMSLGQTSPATAHGMDFSVSPLPTDVRTSLQGLIGPHSNYQLVQVVNSEIIKERTDKGIFACVPKALSSPTPIDVNYPYPSNQISMTSSDSPSSGLFYSALGSGYNLYELRRDFSVTMYLMFDPGIPSGTDSDLCYPAYATQSVRAASQCHGSIPVPLGSISWSFTANGINTLNPNVPQGNGTSWVVAPSCTISGRPNGFAHGTAYPQWQTVNVNRQRSTATFNCTPQNQ
jgi:hypothetical protein